MMSRFFIFLFSVLITALPVSAEVSKGTPVTLSTKDGWALAAVYQPATSKQTTVVLLHDLGKNKEAFASFEKALKASSFAREGVDNPFNKMTRDVDAAIEFLHKKGVKDTDLCVLGAGLGANVAAKSMTFWPDTAMLALISPTSNVRDVLTIPAMRLYNGDILIAAGAADKKMFLEASVIRNVAYLTTGPENGKVTFLTAYDKTSHEMLNQYLIPAVLQWLKTPRRPEVLPDASDAVDTTEQTDGAAVEPSGTEEALVPSVL